jgi:putative ABC transport system permease protein
VFILKSMVELGFKNIFRQKTRTVLTVIGIMIGIAAIVTLGSISEGLRRDISRNLEQASGQIYVYEESSSPIFLAISTSKISEDKATEIENSDGIKDSVKYVMGVGYINEGQAFGEPSLYISGVDPEKVELFVTENAELGDGELLEPGDTYVADIGYQLAEDLDVEVGDTIELEEENFVVKGIFEDFGDPGIDSGAIIPISVAFDLFDTEDYSGVILYPEDLDDVESIAADIEENIEGVTVLSTEEFATQISGIIDQIQIFTVGVAGISAVVGGLGVMNTMIMSVMERRREIGVLKAIGATNGYVLKLILLESAVLSSIGGLLGLIIGFFGAMGMTIATNGSINAYVSLNLAFRSFLFALFLGLVGGYYPSKKASRLSPVEALSYE